MASDNAKIDSDWDASAEVIEVSRLETAQDDDGDDGFPREMRASVDERLSESLGGANRLMMRTRGMTMDARPLGVRNVGGGGSGGGIGSSDESGGLVDGGGSSGNEGSNDGGVGVRESRNSRIHLRPSMMRSRSTELKKRLHSMRASKDMPSLAASPAAVAASGGSGSARDFPSDSAADASPLRRHHLL